MSIGRIVSKDLNNHHNFHFTDGECRAQRSEPSVMTQQVIKMSLKIGFPGFSSDLSDGLHALPALPPLPCLPPPPASHARLQELQHFLIEVLHAAGGSQTTIVSVTSAVTRTHITKMIITKGKKKTLQLPWDLHLAELILGC